jgi:Tfp pilus assembly protein PilO
MEIFRPGSARTLWLAAIIIALGSYAFVFHPTADSISLARQQRVALERHADAETAAIKRFETTQTVRSAIARELANNVLPKDETELSAKLLLQFSEMAAQRAVEVVSVQPEPDTNVRPISAKNKTSNDARFVGFSVSVRGGYNEVVDFIRTASLLSVPVEVGDVSIVRASDVGKVQATIRMRALRPMQTAARA